MTILDDLFKEAEGLWNSIQGTADNTQLVVVNGAMASLSASSLTEGIAFQPRILPIDRLIYNPAAGPPFTPAKFAGSELTITAPNFHTHTFQRDYGILWGGSTSTPATDDVTGVFYFHVEGGGWGGPVFVAVTLYNLRLEAF
jgi:hypothetical protein